MKIKEAPQRVRSSLKFLSDFRHFTSKQARIETGFPEARWSERYTVLGDDTGTTGFDRHYVYHTAWAARVLAKTEPTIHFDFGSLLYFSTLVSAFRPVRFFDYRPAEIALRGLDSEHADLTQLTIASGSTLSASCLHVMEHIGLGRYGDPIDPAGDRKAAAELQRIMAPGGDLLIVVPVGQPKICFNAHRVYSYPMVLELFSDCELVEFSMVPDSVADGDLIPNADPKLVAEQTYGCGCFWFRKRAVG